MAATGDLVGLSCPPFSRMATRQSRRPALQVLPEVNQMGDRMTSQNEQQASDLQGHLPECEAYRNEVGGGCICHHVRACEERLRKGWCVSTCGNTHYTIGYEEGLDAAREAAIRALTDDDGFVRQSELDDVLEYIDALREDQK